MKIGKIKIQMKTTILPT